MNSEHTAAIHHLLKGFVSSEADIDVHDSDLGISFFGAVLSPKAAHKVTKEGEPVSRC